MKVWIEEPCEHGWGHLQSASMAAVVHLDEDECEGGSRREVTINYLAAQEWLKHKHNARLSLADTQFIVDAALGDPE